MPKIKKNINTYTEKIDKSVFKEICFMFSAYGSVKNCVYSRYSSIGSYNKVYNHKKQIRDVWTKDGMLDMFGIPKRYVRMAIDDSIGDIKVMWVQCIKKIKKLIAKNENLSNKDRHYLYYTLKSNKTLHLVLNKKQVDVNPKFSECNIKKLNSLLRRYVRKNLPKKSVSKNNRSILIDAQMYSVKDDYIFISGLKKNKTYKLKLVSIIKLGGNLRLVLDKNKKRIRISNIIDVKTKTTKNENIIGIDKNYNTVFDTSNEGSYGKEFNKLQNKYTDTLGQKNKRRQYYYELIKTYEKKGQYHKVNNIRKFNLGKKKYDRVKNAYVEELNKKINSAVKEMIQKESPKKIVCEDLSFQASSKKKRSKKAKNKLSGFVKGLMQKRLEYISSTKGVEIKKVNAAYTSQICDSCGDFGVRKDDVFYCENESCGKVEYSGHVSAKVILQRDGDQEITLKTPPKEVKAILQKRLLDRDGQLHSSNLNRTNQDLGQEFSSDEERNV